MDTCGDVEACDFVDFQEIPSWCRIFGKIPRSQGWGHNAGEGSVVRALPLLKTKCWKKLPLPFLAPCRGQGTRTAEFRSKEQMEGEGWVFNMDGDHRYHFTTDASSDPSSAPFCKDVGKAPFAQYCGYSGTFASVSRWRMPSRTNPMARVALERRHGTW